MVAPSFYGQFPKYNPFNPEYDEYKRRNYQENTQRDIERLQERGKIKKSDLRQRAAQILKYSKCKYCKHDSPLKLNVISNALQVSTRQINNYLKTEI